jgi:Protein of unknown function (DUF4236)
MSLQFRKRIKIAPGISLNLGKTGVSVSGGIKGARVTVGKQRVTTSAGLPGTGIYSRKTRSTASQPTPRGRDPASGSPALSIIVIAALGALWFFLRK